MSTKEANKVLALYFRPNEGLRRYLEIPERMTADYGIPRAVYTDGHTIFFSPKKDNLTIVTNPTESFCDPNVNFRYFQYVESSRRRTTSSRIHTEIL